MRHEPMSTHSLLELAALDALGLLDDDERESFDRAFKAAPPALQAQVRREQTRIAKDESLLPAVESPAGLRARVLAAVRDAMERVGGQEQPAAVLPAIQASSGVSPIWRMAAIGAVAATLVLGFTQLEMARSYETINDAIESNVLTTTIARDFGVRVERALMDQDTRLVHFAPVSAGTDVAGEAVVILNDRDMTGELLAVDLPQRSGVYQLVLVDSAGEVVGDAILDFEINSATQRLIQQLDLSTLAEVQEEIRLQILAPQADGDAAMLRSDLIES